MPRFRSVTKPDVLAAMKEFKRKTRDEFLDEYDFGRARDYFIVTPSMDYDAKAVFGVAHGYATGEFLNTRSFNGNMQHVVPYLREMGFIVTKPTGRSRRGAQIAHGGQSRDPFVSVDAPDDPVERYLSPISLRRGQPQFRANLMHLYESRCAITGEGPEEVLEAAHIEPHSENGRNSSSNGLLLRSDIHTLFDLNLIRIEPETLTVEIDDRLRPTGYANLHKKLIRPRKDGTRPSTEYLRQRYDEVSGT